jgi:hypothetical protein
MSAVSWHDLRRGNFGIWNSHQTFVTTASSPIDCHNLRSLWAVGNERKTTAKETILRGSSTLRSTRYQARHYFYQLFCALCHRHVFPTSCFLLVDGVLLTSFLLYLRKLMTSFGTLQTRPLQSSCSYWPWWSVVGILISFLWRHYSSV